MKKLKSKVIGIINFSDYKKKRFIAGYGIILFILIMAALISFLPIIWLFITSFKSLSELNAASYHLFPKEFNITKIVDVWQKANFGRYFLNTLIVVFGSVVCSVLFNGLMAYVIAVIKPKGSKLIYYLIMLSYMMPAIVGIISLFQNIVNLNLINSYLPLWLMFGANAFYFINFKNYFESIPKPLFEAAQMDGCSSLGMFFRIVLPLSKPIIGVIAIFTMTAAWSDYLVPSLVLESDKMATVMVMLVRIQSDMRGYGFTQDEFLMLVTISIIPQIILFIIFQKQITGSVATVGIKE